MIPHAVRHLSLLFAVLLLFLLVGCHGLVPPQGPRHALPADSVSLSPGGPHAGTWESFELVISYHYTQRDGVLEIATETRLGEHYRTLYDRLNRLDLYLYLLDADHAVIATVSMSRPTRQMAWEPVSSRRVVPVPSGARSFTFGYHGSVSELEDSATFHKLPH